MLYQLKSFADLENLVILSLYVYFLNNINKVRILPLRSAAISEINHNLGAVM